MLRDWSKNKKKDWNSKMKDGVLLLEVSFYLFGENRKMLEKEKTSLYSCRFS